MHEIYIYYRTLIWDFYSGIYLGTFCYEDKLNGLIKPFINMRENLKKSKILLVLR